MNQNNSTNYEYLTQYAKTDRQLEVLEAIIEAGDMSAASRSLGIHCTTVRKMVECVKRYAAHHGNSPEHGMVHPCADGYRIKGESAYHVYEDEFGNKIRKWVKTEIDNETDEDMLIAFAEELSKDIPKYVPYIPTPETTNKSMKSYKIGDAHIGMKVTKERNGDADWDLEIAERVTVEAIRTLANASEGSEVGMLCDLGDFGHADNMAGTTSSGKNHMDLSGDYGDSLFAQQRIYRKGIDILLGKHKNVIVMMVRGNHNDSTARAVNVMLQAFYENEPRVQVMDNRHKFQHLVYGKNLIVTHHGDRMKPSRAYEYVTRSLSKQWGLCDHKHLVMGHVHHSTSVEIGGMLCETFQALPAGDAWHSDSGYGAKRSMSAIVYDKVHGEVQRHKVSIDQLV
jgi:predicted phosphodiesterase